MSERHGALFTTNGLDKNTLERYLSLPGLTEHNADLITAMFDLCEEEDDNITSIHELAERLNIKFPAVRKRANQLVEMGVLSVDDYPVPGLRRAPKMFTLLSLNATFIPAKPVPLTEHLPVSMDGDMLELMLSNQPRTDDLFCHVMFGALRYSKKYTDTVINTQLRWNGELLPVEVRSTTGIGIAFVTDMRIAIAALTIAEQIILDMLRQGFDVRNRFIVRVEDILAILQLKNQGGNRRTVVAALKRLEATVFRFSLLPSSFIEKFGTYFYDEHSFRFINELSIAGRRTLGSGKIPDAFGFSLAESIFYRMKSSIQEALKKNREFHSFSLFSISPTVMVEKSPIALAFALWARRTIGHHDNKKPYRWGWRTLQQCVAPQTSLKDFRKAMLGLAEERRVRVPDLCKDDDENYVVAEYQQAFLIHGYLVTIDGSDISVRPDPADQYVGIDSTYAKIKQQKGIGAGLRKKNQAAIEQQNEGAESEEG